MSLPPHRLVPGATSTLEERLLAKIVMAGPATPCAVWIGAYNQHGWHANAKRRRYSRPVVRTGGKGSALMYVARLVLILAGVQREWGGQLEAGHRCPTGSPVDGVYRCVDLAHLRWCSRQENEDDKYRVD